MFCPKCGKEIDDEAVVCIGCGCAVSSISSRKNTVTKSLGESSTLGRLAMIFAILIPIVGIILGIVGLCKYQEKANRDRCSGAIICGVIIWIAGICILLLAGGL